MSAPPGRPQASHRPPRPQNTTWQETALCREMPADMFFPEGILGGKGERYSARAAKQVCLLCDVRNQCLKYALDHDERFGVWGGLSERERARLKKGVA